MHEVCAVLASARETQLEGSENDPMKQKRGKDRICFWASNSVTEPVVDDSHYFVVCLCSLGTVPQYFLLPGLP